jgi:hypothetical protein
VKRHLVLPQHACRHQSLQRPLGYTEHLIRQYQLGNIGHYWGGAEQRPGSSLNTTFTSVATRLKLTAHYGGVTKTSDAHRAVAGDEPIEGHALLEN